MDFTQRFKAFRSVSGPLACYITSDQPAAVRYIGTMLTKKSPYVEWDLLQGARGVNDSGIDALNEALALMTASKAVPGEDPPPPMAQKATTNPITMLQVNQFLPMNTVLAMYNAHNYLGTETQKSDGAFGMAQGLINVRDTNKAQGRLTILLGPDFSNMPPELKADVAVFDEPLPTPETLKLAVEKEVQSWNDSKKAGKPGDMIALTPETITASVDALRGIESNSVALQTIAMSISKTGIDIVELRERKRRLVDATQGLKVWRGRSTYADVEGYAEAKEFYNLFLNGQTPVRTIVLIDEIEKAYAGLAGDSSGVTKEMLGTVLTEMQDREYPGGILLGVQGAGKTELVKAVAGEFNLELIYQDIAGAKGQYVGLSNANLRKQFKIINAISDGAALFLATSNNVADLPPELRRRFWLPTFFFDLPDAAEKAKIWSLYKQKYEITGDTPKDDRWTGADIRTCAKMAWSLKISLVAAAKYITPIGLAAKDKIENLRLASSGDKYLSASVPGHYKYVPGAALKATNNERLRGAEDDE